MTFDKRGTGLSDPVMHAPTLEESVDDLSAVMNAAGCERADLVGISEGGTMAMLMAAGHPDRVNALVLYGSFSRLLRTADYPLGVTEEQLSSLVDKAAAGEEIIIAKNGKPMAKLVPMRERTERKPGRLKGKIWMSKDFDAPMPDIEDAFYNGPIE